jgi:hypothetical protein
MRAQNIQHSCVLAQLRSTATPISRVQETGCPREAEHACEGNAPGHLTLGIAHVGNYLPDIPFVLPRHFASHSRRASCAGVYAGDGGARCGRVIQGSGVRRAHHAGSLSPTHNTAGSCPAQLGTTAAPPRMGQKLKDNVNAAAEQGRGSRDPRETDSRARDLTRVMNTGPLARSSLLLPTSSVQGRLGCPGHAGSAFLKKIERYSEIHEHQGKKQN